MNDNTPLEVSAQLNLIASILFDISQSLGSSMSVKDKVAYLVSRGIDSIDVISQILNISKKHASKEKALFKKGQKNEKSE